MSHYAGHSAGLLVTLAIGLLLASCSSLGTTPPPNSSQVTSAEFGSGSIKVALIDLSAPADLAAGTPDAVLLAAQLAAETVAKAPITLLVRRYDGSADALAKVEKDLQLQDVKLIIAPADDTSSLSVARQFGVKGVPVLTLGNISDPKTNLYAFGLSGDIEASLMADEMRRRGYRSVALVADPTGANAVFASKLATAIAAVKIQIASVDDHDASSAAKSIGELASQGLAPAAIVFIDDAKAAASVMKQVRQKGQAAGLTAVGTSQWAFDPDAAAAAGPGWFLAPDGNAIGDFAGQFKKAFKSPPTEDAALAYDLVLLASGLPQALPGSSPYGPSALLNDQGFKGVTGKFWFTPDLQVHRNLMPIEVVPSLAQPAI